MGIKQTITVERWIDIYRSQPDQYNVVSAQNILEPAVNDALTLAEVQALIDDGVTVNIRRRSS